VTAMLNLWKTSGGTVDREAQGVEVDRGEWNNFCILDPAVQMVN